MSRGLTTDWGALIISHNAHSRFFPPRERVNQASPMSLFRPQQHHGVRGPGVLILILGLVHTPSPEPDFHNIRHHDAPGEVCDHHDHLIRWHPGAGVASDVAVLHWHWFFPGAEPLDLGSEPTGPAIHAHVIDWQTSTWEEGPRVSPDPTSRLVGSAEISRIPSTWILPKRSPRPTSRRESAGLTPSAPPLRRGASTACFSAGLVEPLPPLGLDRIAHRPDASLCAHGRDRGHQIG